MPSERRDPFESSIAEGLRLPISGWDTSPVRDRWREPGPPWSYRRMARARLRRVASAIDLGTGGGELLASLAPFPPRMFATEGYPPNVPLARRRLRPLGVEVLLVRGDLVIPRPDASLDLVLDRHEAFDPREVHRVLRPGGTFLTQQVGGRNYAELGRIFGVDSAPATNRLTDARALASEISEAGLRVVATREARYAARFLDLAALVWFLRFAPWEVPGFSVDRDRTALRRVQRRIDRTGALRLTAHRILVVARRPGTLEPVGPERKPSEKKVSHAFCVTAKQNQVT